MTATLLRDVPTWEALADLYGKVAHDDEAAGIVLTEAKRRERLEQQRQARNAERSDWLDAAHAQYMQAERDCAGLLVHEDSPVRDAWSLWSGSDAYMRAHASEELLNWFYDHPRITVGAWRDQIAAGKRLQRDEREQDTTEGASMDTAEAGTYAPEPSAQDTPQVADRTEQIASRVAELRAQGQQRAAQYTAAGRGEVAVRSPGAVMQQRGHVDGAETLRYIFTFLKRFAVWNSEAEIVAATLWIAQSHARDAAGMPIWEYCARFAILGASGSGKSRKSRLLGKLSYKGKILVEPTKPSFIDLCAEHHTVIITEADEAFRSPGRSRGILAVINASYEPDRSSSRKQGGQVVNIPLFVPIVLDGIDKVLLSENRPDLRAMMSRAVCVLSREAPAGYRAPRFDAQARTMAELLSQRISAWMAWEVEDGMANDRPVVPDHLGNRPFSLWEPMFTVALRADKGDPEGPWSAACRDACEELESQFGQADQNEEVKAELDRTMEEWGLE